MDKTFSAWQIKPLRKIRWKTINPTELIAAPTNICQFR
jgi:hypothetical protein